MNDALHLYGLRWHHLILVLVDLRHDMNHCTEIVIVIVIVLQYRHERVKWQKVKDDKSTEGPIEKETRGPNTVNVLAIN